MKPFKVEITEITKGPKELKLQLPIYAHELQPIPGIARPDYILAKLNSPILWVDEKKRINKEIKFVVLCSKFKDQSLKSGVKNITVAIAYVIDNTIEKDVLLDFKKCKYIAVGVASGISKWNIFG